MEFKVKRIKFLKFISFLTFRSLDFSHNGPAGGHLRPHHPESHSLSYQNDAHIDTALDSDFPHRPMKGGVGRSEERETLM